MEEIESGTRKRVRLWPAEGSPDDNDVMEYKGGGDEGGGGGEEDLGAPPHSLGQQPSDKKRLRLQP